VSDSADVKVSLAALPIGNDQDISLRVLKELDKADVVICEDTRKIKRLLRVHNLALQSKDFVALPGSDEYTFSWDSFFKKHSKKNILMVSDGGSPVVNDPGRALIEYCHLNNIAVEALPGPSALTLSLQWGGGYGFPVLFGGFMPKKQAKLKDFFKSLNDAKTMVFFLSPHDIKKLFLFLQKNESGLADCRAYAAREMTKTYQELIRSSFFDCVQNLYERSQAKKPIGELTIVLEGFFGASRHEGELSADFALLRKASLAEAAAALSRLSGRPRKECYSHLVEKSE